MGLEAVNESRRVFPDIASFDAVWKSGRGQGAPPNALAARVGRGLEAIGFRLFHNGGLPRLDRRRRVLREELVFAPGPDDLSFAVRFHLSHDGLGEVRRKYWRPATRAPFAVASGDIGLLESPPVRSIWDASDPETAEAILSRVNEDLLPWFDAFEDPDTLHETLFAGTLPLVDVSTALELMVAEFGVRDARRFLRTRIDLPESPPPATYREGFDLSEDRVSSVVSYFRL